MPHEPDPSDLPPLPPPLLSALAPALLDWLAQQQVGVSLKTWAAGEDPALSRPARHLWANARWCEWLGAEAAALDGRTDAELLAAAEAAVLQLADQRALQAAGGCTQDEHRLERQGRRLEFQVSRQCLPAAAPDQPPLLLSLWRDLGEARRQQALLQQSLDQIERQQEAMAALRSDMLQGMDRPLELFRQAHFETHLRREVSLSQREDRQFSLVLFVVDGAAALRERHGPQAWQRLQQAIAELMRRNTRAMDVLAQLDDDGQFAIIFSGVGLATAYARTEQLRRACELQIVVQDRQPLHFSITAGVASFPHSRQSLEALSQSVQQALAQALQQGGNRVVMAPIELPGQPART